LVRVDHPSDAVDGGSDGLGRHAVLHLDEARAQPDAGRSEMGDGEAEVQEDARGDGNDRERHGEDREQAEHPLELLAVSEFVDRSFLGP